MLPMIPNTMPMATSAALPLSAADILAPRPLTAPAMSGPPPQASGMMGGPMGLPPASAPSSPPWTVKLQADGSSVYQIPNPSGGEPIVLGVNKAPKLPVALQPGKPLGH